MTSIQREAGALLEYLKKERDGERRWGIFYDTVSDVLTLVAILTPFMVTVLLLFTTVKPEVTAVISSVVPGAALGIVRADREIERGKHHMEDAWKFDAWAFRLEHNGEDCETIAREVKDFWEKGRHYPSRAEQQEVQQIIREIEKKKEKPKE